jgi:hypothetical protein
MAWGTGKIWAGAKVLIRVTIANGMKGRIRVLKSRGTRSEQKVYQRRFYFSAVILSALRNLKIPTCGYPR